MMTANPLIVLSLGVVLELALGRVLSPNGKGRLALVTGLGALVATVALVPAVLRDGALDQAFLAWDQGIQVACHVDGLSLIFALMATGIGSVILLYCIGYMAAEPEGLTRFYTLMLVFIGGLVSLVFAANLLLTYVSWEIIGLCSYLLVGFWYKQSEATDGARKVLVMTHLAGYGLLVGILVLYVRSGTFLWTDPALSAAFSTGVFVLMLVAAMAKSVIFPLHTWIPEAMNAPTPVSALLHSACYVKAGVYLVARFYSLATWHPAWHTLVLALGCATMIVGAIMALAQTDLKRLLAFSTISQLGYLITGLGLGTGLGLAAGLFYCLSHGLFKGTLFLCAGSVQHATGTRDMRRLGGMADRMPWTARVWLIAAASIVGVPLCNGFVAKWLLYDAALEAGQMAVLAVAWLVSLFTAFYMLKATVGVFYGPMPKSLREQSIHESPPSMRAGMGVLAAGCLLFGVAPQLLMQPLVMPAVRALGFGWPVSLTWLGVHTGSAGAFVTVGALLVLAALLIGWLIYRLARPAASSGDRVNVFAGGDPLPVADSAVGVADFADMAESALQPAYRISDPDPLYLALWRSARRLALGTDRLVTPLTEGHSLAVAAVLALVVLAAACVI
jgi:multicomponent K+:H+ antiporter subunit A